MYNALLACIYTPHLHTLYTGCTVVRGTLALTLSVIVHRCLARLDSGERSLVATLGLHLVLDGPQVRVAHVHIPRADVPRVLEVGRRPDHGAVDPPRPLLYTLPLLRCGLVYAAREPLHPHLPRHVARLVA